MFARYCLRKCCKAGYYSRASALAASFPEFPPDLHQHIESAPVGTSLTQLLLPWLEGYTNSTHPKRAHRRDFLARFVPRWCCNGCAALFPETIHKCTICGHTRDKEKAFARTDLHTIEMDGHKTTARSMATERLVLNHLRNLQQTGVLQCEAVTNVLVQNSAVQLNIDALCVNLSKSFSVNHLQLPGGPFCNRKLQTDHSLAPTSVPPRATLNIETCTNLRLEIGISKAKRHALTLLKWAQQCRDLHNFTNKVDSDKLVLWMLHLGEHQHPHPPVAGSSRSWTELLQEEEFKSPVQINFVWCPSGRTVGVSNQVT
eukprot:TRINITY_DN64441_c0_g2_i1.p1 TRINITY_DN64441_c0_g2~~TRINITY_DN64441_c0_g2_i1.p1  ORF type:complete len:315 (+),score=26.94 TRINITY_DN64441_c0_g2_i1:33-977(+)